MFYRKCATWRKWWRIRSFGNRKWWWESCFPAIIWLKYCQFGVKTYQLNHLITFLRELYKIRGKKCFNECKLYIPTFYFLCEMFKKMNTASFIVYLAIFIYITKRLSEFNMFYRKCATRRRWWRIRSFGRRAYRWVSYYSFFNEFSKLGVEDVFVNVE